MFIAYKYNITYYYMKKNLTKHLTKHLTRNWLICSFSIIIIIALLYFNTRKVTSNKTISQLTDNWIREVTVENNPDSIYKLFCSDGNLIGTVSQVKRKGEDIKRYFDYFAKLPGLKVVSKKYNISKITNDVYLNTAFIEWHWQGLENPVIARMTFIYRGECIFQLHSSVLPELNEDLHKISDAR